MWHDLVKISMLNIRAFCPLNVCLLLCIYCNVNTIESTIFSVQAVINYSLNALIKTCNWTVSSKSLETDSFIIQ